MENKPPSWYLKQKESILGVLAYETVDQPWFRCSFHAEPEFDTIKPLFDRELELLESDQIEAFEQAYEKIIELGLSLEEVDQGTRINEFLLHVKDQEAWFRY